MPDHILDDVAADIAAEKALDSAHKTRAGFNTEYAQLAMEMIFGERRRQVKLGRAGKIPHACEAADTDWGYRIGVLGEEYGEVCKEHIEDNSNSHNMLTECIQVAAVAMACAEGLMRRHGMDPGDITTPNVELVHTKCPTCGDGLGVRQDGYAETEGGIDPHVNILMRANNVKERRNATYRDIWKTYGWRGCLTHFRTCAERSFVQWYNAEPGVTGSVDNLIDGINYAVFAIRNIEEGNRDGNWQYD